MDNKKKIILALVVIVASMGLIIYTFIPKNAPPPFENDNERSQYIKNFLSKEKGNELNIKSNEGGYSGVVVKNKQYLLKVTDLDTMLAINENITNNLTFMNKIYNDSKKFKNNDVEKYYEKNLNVIKFMLGIENLNDFKLFIGKLDFFNNTKINSVEIDETPGVLSKENNSVFLKLILKTTNGNSQIFDIKYSSVSEDNKNINLFYWK